MTKAELKKILDRLDFYLELDRKIQAKYDQFTEVIAPTSYKPIIENGSASGFIEGVTSIPDTEGLKEHLEYYAYEVQSMKVCNGKVKGKEYNLKKKSEYIDFVLDSV